MKSHRDLEVWRRSVDLVTDIYAVTRSFPVDELYGLTGQMRRAAVSVPSNIAEGAARNSHKEFLRYLSISVGSLAEIETQLLIARNLGYLPSGNSLDPEIDQIRKMLHGLINSIKRKIKQEY
ncbi:four helix bundle protein [Desulfuromonas sp. TF]|uniref:four helix bundle protein n=1 Tax=Desulfuromonas sp. TF TaxID=1232410 RepID=UPI000482FCFD|nr:four helix bundle protein [Desulfuromonas sp. TF]